jgi:hypothetical protein
MSDFIPAGYKKILDCTDPQLRNKLVAGELVAAAWNPKTGELIELVARVWLGELGRLMIEKGYVINELPRQRFEILIKVDDQAPVPTKHQTGPRPGTSERVRREMTQYAKANGLKSLLDMKVVEMESRFKAGRGTVLKARKAVRV